MDYLFVAAVGLLLALLVTGWATPAVKRLSTRLTWTDRPDGLRKLHVAPTPSAGGLAIFAGLAAGLAAAAAAAAWVGVAFPELHPIVYLGALAIVATGAYDDVHGLGFKPKLLVECTLAYALVFAGYRIDLSGFGFFAGDPYTEALVSLPLTLLWVVGVINAVNLIDGVDGLAAGTAAISVATLGIVFGLQGNVPLVLIAVCLVGALAGFLIHNFNPASIFMGDSGSLLLGYTLAVFSLVEPAHTHPLLALLVPVLALGLPLLDTTVSMLRRLIERRAIFAPDADHIHHRMVERFSVKQAVLVLYVVSGIFGAAAVIVSQAPFGVAVGIAAVTLVAALAFVLMLGYVRRPYVQPTLRVIGEVAERDAPPTSGDGAPGPSRTDVRPAVPDAFGEPVAPGLA